MVLVVVIEIMKNMVVKDQEDLIVIVVVFLIEEVSPIHYWKF